MKRISAPFLLWLLIMPLIAGCVSQVYKPGPIDSPLNRVKLGQTYGDMIAILGNPNSSESEDRMAQETFILFFPVWNIAELIGDFNPSAIQIYHYDGLGKVTIDNNNKIIRIESK
jgi:hypothetical protein